MRQTIRDICADISLHIQYKSCFLLRWFDGQNVQKTCYSVHDARTKRHSKKHLMSTKMATSSSYSTSKLSSHWSSTTRTSAHNLWNSRFKSQLDFNWQKQMRHLHHIHRARILIQISQLFISHRYHSTYRSLLHHSYTSSWPFHWWCTSRSR